MASSYAAPVNHRAVNFLAAQWRISEKKMKRAIAETLPMRKDKLNTDLNEVKTQVKRELDFLKHDVDEVKADLKSELKERGFLKQEVDEMKSVLKEREPTSMIKHMYEIILKQDKANESELKEREFLKQEVEEMKANLKSVLKERESTSMMVKTMSVAVPKLLNLETALQKIERNQACSEEKMKEEMRIVANEIWKSKTQDFFMRVEARIDRDLRNVHEVMAQCLQGFDMGSSDDEVDFGAFKGKTGKKGMCKGYGGNAKGKGKRHGMDYG